MKLSDDLKSAKWIYCKAALFVMLAAFSAALLLLENLSFKVALLLAICVWASCRAYYFAFYVIEHYVDHEFRFSGLFDFVKYILAKNKTDEQ